MRKSPDWLNQQLGSRKRGNRESGISTLDIVKLPPNQRKIMRVLLRKARMTYSDLCKVVESMPEAERMNQDDLDETLEALSDQGWLIRGSDEHTTYRVNDFFFTIILFSAFHTLYFSLPRLYIAMTVGLFSNPNYQSAVSPSRTVAILVA